jgi:hypothetical protein
MKFDSVWTFEKGYFISNARKATVSRNEPKVRRGWTMDSRELKNKASTSQTYRASIENMHFRFEDTSSPITSRYYLTSTSPFYMELMDIPHHSGSTQSDHP